MDVFFFLRSKIPLQFFFASIMLEHPLHRRKITICIHDIFMIHFKSNIFLRGKNKSLLFKTESESHQHYKYDKIPLNKCHSAIHYQHKRTLEGDIKTCGHTALAFTSSLKAPQKRWCPHQHDHAKVGYAASIMAAYQRVTDFSFFSLSNCTTWVTYPTAFRYRKGGYLFGNFQFWSFTVTRIYVTSMLQALIINCI